MCFYSSYLLLKLDGGTLQRVVALYLEWPAVEFPLSLSLSPLPFACPLTFSCFFAVAGSGCIMSGNSSSSSSSLLHVKKVKSRMSMASCVSSVPSFIYLVLSRGEGSHSRVSCKSVHSSQALLASSLLSMKWCGILFPDPDLQMA